MTRRARRQGGFTLVELMVVVAIIEILASIALPNFQRSMLRSRAAEREIMAASITRAVEDYYGRNDRFPSGPGNGTSNLNCAANPALPAQATKRPLENRPAEDWGKLSLQVSGSLYYSYEVLGAQVPATSTYGVTFTGDLDGDGEVFFGWENRQLSQATWRVVASGPVPGSPASLVF